MDAESCGVNEALAHANVELRENARVERLCSASDGKRVTGVEALIAGERTTIAARIVILAAGAVNSAALLLASREGGVANRSDAVGRHFMNHNCSAVLAIDPRSVNDSVYQKTLGINDFYLDDGRGGPPLGNIQLLGRVTGPILKSNIRMAPEWALDLMSRRSVDWYAMSEDLPNPDSRVTVDGGQIRLDWKRSNWTRARRAREGLQGAIARRGLSDRPVEAFRPPHAVASMRHRSHRAAIRRLRRSIPTAAPGTTRTCLSSTRPSFRPRPASTRR